VRVGFAISKVDEQEAARTYQYLAEMDRLAEVNSPDIDSNGPEGGPWKPCAPRPKAATRSTNNSQASAGC
jgi:hypothetical protein